MLSHNAFLSLHDTSPAAVQTLVDSAQKYLKNHPGIVFFAAGSVAMEFSRPVNDRMFDVALNIVFVDKESHDAYQVAEDHKRFIEENNSNWKQVRIFDSWVS